MIIKQVYFAYIQVVFRTSPTRPSSVRTYGISQYLPIPAFNIRPTYELSNFTACAKSSIERNFPLSSSNRHRCARATAITSSSWVADFYADLEIQC